MRSGLVVKKIGMTRIYTKIGTHIPVTILHLQKCQVIAHKTIDKHGYTAIQIGVCDAKNKNINKPMKGIFNKLSIHPKKKIVEFRVSPKNLLNIGKIINVNHFLLGQKVDITGKSIGKGFSGVIKRHNFSGHRASHGNSVTHRSHGSTGQRQDPGKVFKGKKMAGRMGNKKVTIQNLTILYLDEKNNIIIIKGSVPGSRKSLLLMKDSIKSSNINVPIKENFLQDE